MPRHGDWTYRSALVRLAQPDPTRVGLLLALTRRLDATVVPLLKAAERHTVVADRAISAAHLDRAPVDPVIDARVSDLARLVAAGMAPEPLLGAYGDATDLTGDEAALVPVLALTVTIDGLAAELTEWADDGPRAPAPVASVDRAIHHLATTMDRLGVPEETGPPSGARPRRR
jgi:hypothetical protein